MKCVNSQAILKYGIRIALTQETKPKMKNSRPMMRMEMVVSFFVNELMSTGAVAVLFMKNHSRKKLILNIAMAKIFCCDQAASYLLLCLCNATASPFFSSAKERSKPACRALLPRSCSEGTVGRLLFLSSKRSYHTL